MNTNIPVSWNSLPDIDIVPTNLSKEDEECLTEIKDVLIRRKKETVFGVTLLHKHFDMQDGEVLFETQDVKKRTLELRPEKLSTIRDKKITCRPTTWRFDEEGAMVYSVCPGAIMPNDVTAHYGYSDDNYEY